MAHARFETLLTIDEGLADRRRRLLMGGALAMTLSMGMGVMSWTASKLGISSVAPPKSFYSVTMAVLEAPPPPAPPPAPAGGAAQDERREAPPDEVVPDEPEVAPTEVVKLDLDAPPKVRATVPGKALGGGPGIGRSPGVPGGTGTHCPLPPCLGTQQVISGPPIHRPEPPKEPPIKAPIATVMASSVFTPDPDQAELARTPTGRTHRSPGKTTISFCIGGDGKTHDVRVHRGFRGDPEVGEICRKTVAKWRFSPQRVGGKVRSTCSSVTFDIRFE
ncbi:hypothetical protein [Paraliomyxa miuraensis]|uniref:hypothetical protein n=1 Tax=Paraliomyxa miuraensis TaxID=376150 RepID=UPI0022563297|nr:hypothetical protein [Paraliomyxa miuraensis]MCX4245684.1 hypothetical protein [Paraliomyxa miuraensis]